MSNRVADDERTVFLPMQRDFLPMQKEGHVRSMNATVFEQSCFGEAERRGRR
jgi:hypothetical protein